MHQVACLGILVADLTAGPLSHYPEKGKLVLTPRMQLSTGGCAANPAMVLAKLGVQASLMAKVGNDELGDYVVGSVSRRGVDTGCVRRDPVLGTGCSMVLNSEEGERSFITSLGANSTFGPLDLDRSVLASCKLIHLGGALLLPGIDGTPTAELFRWAQQHGITTCLDTAWDATGRWRKAIEACFPYTDLFLPSLVEAEQLTGKSDPAAIAQDLLNAGIKVVGLKMGSKGSQVYTAGKSIVVPCFPVQTLDTNGAGDAYVAGFIAAWIHGFSLEETAKFANVVGALATTAFGPTDGIKSFAEVSQLAGVARPVG